MCPLSALHIPCTHGGLQLAAVAGSSTPSLPVAENFLHFHSHPKVPTVM
jgi:hypothetical protein